MPLAIKTDFIPDELKEISRWLVWDERKEKNKKGESALRKVAINPDGFPCRWKQKDSWMSFDAAINRYKKEKLAGVGIVLTGEDGLFGLDLDESYSDKLKQETYTELSPSGKGLRAFGFVEGIDVSRHPRDFGLFTHNRWLSVTGHKVSRYGHLANCTESVTLLIESLAARNGSGSVGMLDKSQLAELIKENWRFAKIWRFEADKDYDSVSEMDAAIVWHAIKSGWEQEATKTLLIEFRHRAREAGYDTKGKEVRDDYVSRTVERVAAQIKTEIEEMPYLTLEQALDVPDTKWLVDGAIPDGCLGMIWGPEGTCKTFMMFDLALRLMCNKSWFGERKCRHGDVLYILSEGRWTIGSRFRAWFNHHRDAKTTHNISIWESAPQIVNSSDVTSIAQFISRRLPKCKLVVVDTLSRSLVGQDENNSMYMSKMVDQMTRLAIKTGATVILVHHATKGGIEGPPTARGSSAIRAAVDFSIEVKKVFPIGQRVPLQGIFEITCDKSRGGPPFESFPVYLKRSGPGAVVETHKILTDWMAHRRKKVYGISADQFVALLEFKKANLSASTIEGLLQKRGIGMSRNKIEEVLAELFPEVPTNSSH